MRRREFLTVLGTAAAWPLPIRAQQPAMPVVGFLTDVTPYYPEFRRGLLETGYTEGRNVLVEYRRAEGRNERLSGITAEFVSRNVAVIVANGVPAALAAKAATSTIPVVFLTAADPVRAGLVTSFSEPTGNVSGVTSFNAELPGNRLRFLRDLVPSAKVLGVLVNPRNALAESTSSDLESAAKGLGLELQFVGASTEEELAPAFASAAENRAAGLLVAPDPFFIRRREPIVRLVARHALPAIYPVRDFVQVGGLMSYGMPNSLVTYRQAGNYAGRILKGSRPSDLPVWQPTKFELLVNLRTAKALRLEIPASLRTAADAVIE